MYSSFFGIELGKRALISQQLALHTTAHNITNANTAGYSRQISNLETTTPFLPGSNRLQIPVQLGTGVKLGTVQRARDMILEGQIHQECSALGTSASKTSYLTRVNELIQEPSDESVGDALSDFWAAWQELSVYPEDSAVRSTVVATGQRLSYLLRTKDQELENLQQTADDELRSDVSRINQLASQIRDLNVRINQSLGVENQPNDLYDSRDRLLEELSTLTNYEGHQMPNGLYSITINGHTLVQDEICIAINVGDDPSNNNFAALTWADDGAAVEISAGEIQGLEEIRDVNLPVYRQALEDLAQGLMSAVNPVHAAGYALNSAAVSGEDFFTGTSVEDFTVNPSLVADSSLLAAAQNPSAPGDGSNALALAQLQNGLTMAAGSLSFGDFYESLVAQVGLDSQHNSESENTQDTLVSSLQQQRESMSGVNLDEEMTDMIRYQDGYQAAIRVISTMDEMLNTIINKMGAGR